MNSDYRLLSTPRNIFCCVKNVEDENDDNGLTIDQLIKSLHISLLHKNYERTEVKLRARKYAMKGDKERAISELTLYNTKSIKYEQLTKVYTKACLLRDSIGDAHDFSQITNTMEYTVQTHPVHDIKQEWEDIMMKTDEIIVANETQYEDLCDPDVIIDLPDVPTHTPVIVKKRTKIHAT